MIRPIPRKRLPHQANYKAYTGNSGEGDTYSIAVPLKYIKIEDRLQFRYTNNGREVVGNALMFYDYVNSSGLSDKPIQNSIITFKNHDYKVVDTEILYDDKNNPHHYEVLLK